MDKGAPRTTDSSALDTAAPPFLVALNLTRRCNLACAHCYLDAGARSKQGPRELTTAQVTALLDRIAALGGETMVVLTGGEPLLRRDLCTIAAHASGLGLMVVVGTNGTLLDDQRVRALQAAGVRAVGISLDSLDPGYHDRFRAYPGAWAKTMRGIDACRRAGLLFQIHFTVTDDNAHELDAIIGFAHTAGAAVLNVFFLVCTGRGASFTRISDETYEAVLRRVAEAARQSDRLIVRARCAPHFKRIALEMTPPLPITLLDGYEAGGCLAGTRYCRVTPEGEVTPCPYMEVSVGSVLDEDFASLWREAPLLRQLRAPALGGRCGACEYRKLCGGCRARPLARSGDLMGEDFLCRYRPIGGAVIEPQPDLGAQLAWTPEAEDCLARIPPFIRGFVRRRAQTRAAETGVAVVTADFLHELARRRFPMAGPPRSGDGELAPARRSPEDRTA